VVVNINGNWIKLFTKFVAWEWYKDQNTKALFIHCLLKANWKDGKFEGMVIPRGSFVTGRKKLAQELGLSEQEVRTALKHLISTNELTSKTTNKFSIISVVNYELYQQVNQQLNQQSTNNQPTTNQQLTTIEEYKNNRISDYVCDNTHTGEECFSCHLGSKYKTEDCYRCMKKLVCPLPEEPTFSYYHNGMNFIEFVKDKDAKKKEFMQQMEEMKNNRDPDTPFIDYNWLEDKGDEK
jgi:hypothetical protein